MNWIKQLNATIDYIEEHLADTISYEEIARLAQCSIYNFQRMFSYIAEKSLADYIRCRRLTLAAIELVRTEEKILDIALKYGYESPDSFTRAFKVFHGITPAKVRSQTVQLKSCPKLTFKLTVTGGSNMNYQIEEWPAFTAVGFSYPMETKRAFEIVPRIWDEAWQNGRMDQLFEIFKQTDYRPAGYLGFVVDSQGGNAEEMDYFLGVTNHVDVADCQRVAVPEGLQEIKIAAATWIVIEANGELPDAVQKVYKQFYSEWLPSSGYQLLDLPVIECYLQDNRQEVWFALK